MYIESSINEKYIRTLGFGSFPKHVLSFQESKDFLQQLIFIDYQLQLLIQNEFSGNELLNAKHFSLKGNESPREKLVQLITYANSVTANYNDSAKKYEEHLYYLVIMAHLYYLNSQLEDMEFSLNSVTVSPTVVFNAEHSIYEHEFVQYLNCRFHVLKGLINEEVWSEYLHYHDQPFKKSQVAASHWLDLLFFQLATSIQKEIAFSDLENFVKNPITLFSFGAYLLRPENSNLIDSRYKIEFSAYLADDLELLIANKLDFPHASETKSPLSDYVNNLYQSLSQIPASYNILKPTLTKKFLVNSTSKTFQSHAVTANLIKTLIQLGEHDEAFAAFKTYVAYLENDQGQKHGYIEDILTVIEIYSICILQFNPLKAIIPENKKKFKYTLDDHVVSTLKEHTEKLLEYLNKLAVYVDLSYLLEGESEGESISFLYHKYNVNLLLSDHSQFVELISKAWFSLGYFYYYLSSYDSPNRESLLYNTKHVLKYYKNSLIVNSTGNVLYLFNYALALSLNRDLKSSLKLCKFILKKYPELFKTWNLMVLLLSSFEANDPDYIKPAKLVADTSISTNLPTNPNPHPQTKESEKFINNALNIAGLFIVKHRQRDIKLTVESKYEILQLKLTQLAVWESIYGVQYILEFLSEVFILYHELFAVELEPPRLLGLKSSLPLGNDAKWSHRPSFIDPSPITDTAVLENGSIADRDTPTKRPSSRDRLESLKGLSAGSIRRKSLGGKPVPPPKTVTPSTSNRSTATNHSVERKILQDIWLWTSSIYMKVGLLEESELCIVESETVYEPNVKTFTALGYLTSKSRKFLSLQELERSLEILNKDTYNKVDYGRTLLGLCKLFILDDQVDSSLFISSKDLDAGLIRLKNLLEKYVLSWPYGYNSPEVWHYLSKIYEIIDDKILLTKSLWKCIELEDFRPVRGFEVCDSYVSSGKY